jgi:3-deoxy-manno-octulosonate cytidylyltransferase (CMP-KDO synthetase)
MRHVLAVIPARYASTRLPGKPLLPILGGEPMIAHVVRRVLKARMVQQVLVATDHEAIAEAAKRAGANAIMTDSALPTGTHRVAAAVRHAGMDADVIVNVQGDEPLIEPDAIDLSAQMLMTHAAADVATLSAPLSVNALLDPNRVKVVCGPLQPAAAGSAACAAQVEEEGGVKRALYFSRGPIGVDRDELGMLLRSQSGSDDRVAGGRPAATWCAARLHVGLYAFRPAALEKFVSLPSSQLESFEQLEQMRALEAGMTIAVGEVTGVARGVDTAEDVEWLERHWRRHDHEQDRS